MSGSQIKVKFLVEYKEVVGEREKEISAETVRQLLEKLSEKYEDLRKDIYKNPENKEINKFINILVNGRRINLTKDLDTELEEGDTVSIFSAVAGG